MTDTFEANIIKKLGRDNFRKVQDARVGIAGAGGLGSNCALNLIRVGFKKLTIIDFDIIDPSNLDRQFYFYDQIGMNKVEALKINLCRIIPGLELIMVNRKIEKDNVKDIFSGCDVVAECLDRAEYKSMLIGELLKLDKFIVTVSGLGGFGSSDDIQVHRLRKDLVMIGDLRSDICHKPALSPRVNVAAAKQADIILEHVVSRANSLT